MTTTNANHSQDISMTSTSDTVVDHTDDILHHREKTLSPNYPPAASLLFFMDPPSATSSPSPLSRPIPLPLKEHTVDPRRAHRTIPPAHPNRTLVLCFDGTGDQFDSDNSNIVQFCSLLRKDDAKEQMVYYQAGIGTYVSPKKVASPWISKIRKTVDLMIASDLDAHVMDGYEFLMQNYTANDRICIFGFSRGAYTARSLAGMIHKVGLLPAYNYQQVPFAYKMYTRADKVGWEQSDAFRQAFSREVTIDFIGVWDTVDSVGLIPKRLPFTTSNTIVRTFRHAVSLDERRAKFKPNLWNHSKESKPQANEPEPTPTPEQSDNSHVPLNPQSPPHRRGPSSNFFKEKSRRARASRRAKNPSRSHSPSLEWLDEDERQLSDYEDAFSIRTVEAGNHPTDVEEVWFAGCHCDVGGGSVKNSTRHSLARISLRWMIRECFKASTGIMFDSQRLRSVGLDPSALYPFVTPRPPPLPTKDSMIEPIPPKEPSKWRRFFSRRSTTPPPDTQNQSSPSSQEKGKAPAENDRRWLTEEEEELRDALSPRYDQLSLYPFWWILEIIPMQFRQQKTCDEWVNYFGCNLARPRSIPDQHVKEIKVHRSVKMRADATKIHSGKPKKYRPRARFDAEPMWVD